MKIRLDESEARILRALLAAPLPLPGLELKASLGLRWYHASFYISLASLLERDLIERQGALDAPMYRKEGERWQGPLRGPTVYALTDKGEEVAKALATLARLLA